MLKCVGFVADEVLILEGKRQSNYEYALFRHLKMITEELQQKTFLPRLSEQLTFCLCFPDDHHISSSTS
jgi:hypothetical protein